MKLNFFHNFIDKINKNSVQAAHRQWVKKDTHYSQFLANNLMLGILFRNLDDCRL